MKYRIIFIITALLLFISCQQTTEDVDYKSHEILFDASVSSRSTMENGFIAYDGIGIFMIPRSDANKPSTLSSLAGNWINNGHYYYDSFGKWSAGDKNYWKDGVTVSDVIAYYPYYSMESSTDVTSYQLDMKANQTQLANLRYCDFLYGTASKIYFDDYSNGIPIALKHKLSKINIVFDLPSGISLINDRPVVLHDVILNGKVNFATGIVTPSTSATTVYAYYSASDKKAECIVMPQTIAGGKDLITVFYLNTADSKTYRLTYSLGKSLVLESGKEYEISIKIPAI